MPSLVAIDRIRPRIPALRGQRVMQDSDLAELYGVPTHRLNEQVRRNASRFPLDFMFQLTAEETAGLRSQIAISKPGRGGRRFAPPVFTEQGIPMLSSVLKIGGSAFGSGNVTRATRAWAGGEPRSRPAMIT